MKVTQASAFVKWTTSNNNAVVPNVFQYRNHCKNSETSLAFHRQHNDNNHGTRIDLTMNVRFRSMATTTTTTTRVVHSDPNRHPRSYTTMSAQTMDGDIASTPSVSLTMRMDDTASSSIVSHADAIVCGGGPAGLLTAIMLAQQQQSIKHHHNNDRNEQQQQQQHPRFRNIQLYDRLSVPPNPDDETIWDSDVAKFYLIGLGGRGQSALRHFHVWDMVQERSVAVIGRKDWSPNGPPEGVETIKRGPTTTQVLPRDKLVGVLYQYIREHYSDRISLNYGVEVQPIDFDYDNGDGTKQALIRVAKCTSLASRQRINPSSLQNEESINSSTGGDVVCDIDVQYVSTPLLVAADGTVRTIANTIASLDQERVKLIRRNPIARVMAQRKAFFVKRYIDDNQRVYKTIPLIFPKDWRSDLNYSARTADGRANLEALPANPRGGYCGVLLLRDHDPMAQANTDPIELRKMLDETMPQFSALLDDAAIVAIAQKPVSYLPTFRYIGPRLHEGDCTVLLGDCAHTVKPYFGLGANSALEDVKILGDYLSSNENIAQAIHLFSKHRAPESKTLVRVSRDLDRPGKLGFIMFIVPIILDAMFQKFAPQLFMPNVITMLQRESYTFQRLARRKRLDRIVQIAILGTGFSLVGFVAQFVVGMIAKLIHVRPVLLWTTFVVIAITLNKVKVMSKKPQEV
jgi:kynurenine 3-monooxygenase